MSDKGQGQAASELIRIFESNRATGAVGIALGSKEVNSVQHALGEPAVAFFVHRKEPRRGRRVALASGRRVVPKVVTIAGSSMATDVVETVVPPVSARPPRLQRTTFTAGGPIGNRGEIGSIGCIVTRQGSPYPYILTNRHVALDPGSIVYIPSFEAPGAIAAVTRASVDLVPDEDFLPFWDAPARYFDVDAALVQIPGAKEGSVLRSDSDDWYAGWRFPRRYIQRRLVQGELGKQAARQLVVEESTANRRDFTRPFRH